MSSRTTSARIAPARLLIVACVLGATLAFSAGCTDDASQQQSGMGMGGGATSADGSVSTDATTFAMGVGVIAAEKNAIVAPDARAASGSMRDGITVARVVAPADSWLVVRSALAPGAVLGKAQVKRGENRDVIVPLDRIDGPQVRLALHADRGTKGTFDFDPTARRRGTDVPIYTSGKPVEKSVTLVKFGATVGPHVALLKTESQLVMDNTVSVSYVLLPGPSWISVHRLTDDGFMGKRIGLIGRAAGEAPLVPIPLTEKVSAGDRLVITAIADNGLRDVFEFSADKPMDSPDQPYVSEGLTVAQRIVAK
jgi:hypothetical protein